jgi:hypothetical protein
MKDIEPQLPPYEPVATFEVHFGNVVALFEEAGMPIKHLEIWALFPTTRLENVFATTAVQEHCVSIILRLNDWEARPNLVLSHLKHIPSCASVGSSIAVIIHKQPFTTYRKCSKIRTGPYLFQSSARGPYFRAFTIYIHTYILRKYIHTCICYGQSAIGVVQIS